MLNRLKSAFGTPASAAGGGKAAGDLLDPMDDLSMTRNAIWRQERSTSFSLSEESFSEESSDGMEGLPPSVEWVSSGPRHSPVDDLFTSLPLPTTISGSSLLPTTQPSVPSSANQYDAAPSTGSLFNGTKQILVGGGKLVTGLLKTSMNVFSNRQDDHVGNAPVGARAVAYHQRKLYNPSMGDDVDGVDDTLVKNQNNMNQIGGIDDNETENDFERRLQLEFEDTQRKDREIRIKSRKKEILLKKKGLFYGDETKEEELKQQLKKDKKQQEKDKKEIEKLKQLQREVSIYIPSVKSLMSSMEAAATVGGAATGNGDALVFLEGKWTIYMFFVENKRKSSDPSVMDASTVLVELGLEFVKSAAKKVTTGSTIPPAAWRSQVGKHLQVVREFIQSLEKDSAKEREMQGELRAAERIVDMHQREKHQLQRVNERYAIEAQVTDTIALWASGKDLPRMLNTLIEMVPFLMTATTGGDSGTSSSSTLVPLPDDAAPGEVRRTYKRALRIVHPDKVGMLQLSVTEAYTASTLFSLLKSEYDSWEDDLQFT